MSHISQPVIEQIRERVDIADVVSAYVTLSKAGQNLKGLCPFHADKTPSFNVSPSRQLFHCFGCGLGGDVFKFLMEKERMAFPEAVRELGNRAGIAVSEDATKAETPERHRRERIERHLQAAAAWFQHNLSDANTGREARDYLVGRGITAHTIDAFGLGVAPPLWDGLIRAVMASGATPTELSLAGLIVPKEQAARRPDDPAAYYDRFRDRVMFPITDLKKRIVGFGGRVIREEMPKYLNSPETELFNKGRLLYGLDRAREAAGRLNHVLLVEGYFDAIALHQAGITNVVATLGTALTPEHLRLIRPLTGKVVLLFDPDDAGVRASLRTLDLFAGTGIGVTVMSLPDGDDPDTFVRRHGAAAFGELQERSPSLLDFAVEHSLRKAVSGALDDRIRSIDEILRILQKTGQRIEKEECLRRVSERLGISQQRLNERYPELLPKPDRRRVTHSIPPREGVIKRNPEEWDLVHLLLHGHLAPAQVRALCVESFTVPVCRRLVELARSHVDADGRVRIRALLDAALADSACAPVATELSMSERHFDDVAGHVTGCLNRLERNRRDQTLAELIVRLRAAEREGHEDEARRLNVQIKDLRVRKAEPPLPVA